MALNLLYQFTLRSSYTGDFVSGNVVKSYWDDVSLSIKVHVFSSTGTDLGEKASGPTVTGNYSSRSFRPINYQYKFCDGTTLNSFTLYNIGSESYENAQFVFPYAQRVQTANHFSCVAEIVCDIQFTINLTSVVHDSGVGDGEITVNATTSYGSPRYTRDPNATFADADPANSGSNFVITGLAAGSYVIYAIDTNGCKAQITVIVKDESAELSYSTRWRLEYEDERNLGTTRVDIEEAEYAGSVVEVKGAEDPVILSWRGETIDDIFTTFIASECQVSLISRTHFQFLDIFTEDERKFRVKYYRDTGSGFVLKWVGFVLPMLYQEQYFRTEDYAITITATDQIGILKDHDFLDDFGNEIKENISFLDAISIILRKTDIDLNIHESVNIFAEGMDTGDNDSALQQAYINPSIYYQVGSEKVFIDGRFETIFNNEPKKCDYVLNQLLVSWGARLYQADGYWRIELVEEKSDVADYRIFNLYGIHQSSGTYQTVVDLRDAADEYIALKERSGILNILPSYNKIRFEIDRGFKNNLLTSGDFETRDIVNGQFKGWGFDITNGAGITYGYEKYKEPIKDSLGGLFINFNNTNAPREIVIQSEPFELQLVDNVNFKFSFDIMYRPVFEGFYYYVDYSIKIGDKYVTPYNLPNLSPGTSLIDGEYLRVFTDDALKWNTIEKGVLTSLRQLNSTLEGPVVVKIRVKNIPMYEYGSIASLKAFATDNVDYLSQRGSFIVSVLDGDLIRYYRFISGTNAESSPDILRPNDFHATNNPYVWKLDKSIILPTENVDYLLDGVIIDNVILSVEREFDELIYEKSFNPRIKQDLVKQITHSDFALTVENIEVPESDPNLERIVSNFIKLSDGTTTDFWGRRYVTGESEPLMVLLMNMYQGQVTSGSMKISGNTITNQEVSFSTLFNATFLDKKFVNMYMAIHDFERFVDVELLELKTGDDGAPPADIYEFTEEFTTEFNA
jgi:hypothetical protein